MRRSLVLGVLAVALVGVLPTTAVGAGSPVVAEGSGAEPAARGGAAWAASSIATVVRAGLMGPDVAAFRPDDPLTRGDLYLALVGLGRRPTPPAQPQRVVTMRELDAQLVNALGALPAARAIRLAALEAGLAPTAMLGTETVARLLGLRTNHPAADEALERRPHEPAPRAEAAYSFARALAVQPAQVAALVAQAQALALPALDELRTEVLRRALRLVGYPYVWAGTSEKPQRLWSATGGTVPAPGGFDCSGFVWRVYKLEPFAIAPSLAAVLRGRTTYEMSGEVKATQRIKAADLQPGDVLFFGSRGTRSKPSQVGHAGIYVGSDWFVHSSGAGVTLQPLTGWYAKSFAWARRPIAEAGLEPA
jgi:cell wall-associated NlpC family hydrolase